MAATERRVAYVFEECTGKWHVCDDEAEMLDTRGTGYDSKNEAIGAARRMQGYSGLAWTHYRTGNGPIRKL